MKTCAWCGEALVRRTSEGLKAFAKRRHCSRSCQVRTQNSERAAAARRMKNTPHRKAGA